MPFRQQNYEKNILGVRAGLNLSSYSISAGGASISTDSRASFHVAVTRSDPALQQTTLLPRNRACLLEPRRQGRRRELPPLLPANPRAGELPLQHQGHRYDPTLRRSLLRARHRRQSEGRRREGRHLRRRRRVETFRSGRASGRRASSGNAFTSDWATTSAA